MRIAYLSDLHIEIRSHRTQIISNWTRLYPLLEGPDLGEIAGNVDLVVLAGDISTGDPTSDMYVLKYASQVADFVGAQVIFVPGNHEYYGGVFEVRREEMISASVEGVTVLDRNEARYHFDADLRILGATLWTDYRLLGDQKRAMEVVGSRLNDHRLISLRAGRRFLPEDAFSEHRKSRSWLLERLGEKHDGPTIIVTHHVPHPSARNPQFSPDDDLSPAFESDCTDVLQAASQAGVRHWIFGHHHCTMNIDLQGIHLLSAQLGYPWEDAGWRGPGTIELWGRC